MDLYKSFIDLGRIMEGKSSFLFSIPSPDLGVGAAVMFVLVVGIVWDMQRQRSSCIYLVAFSCYKPPEDRKMNTELSKYVIHKSDPMPESLKFAVNVHIKSGLGQQTYAPNSFFQADIMSSMAEGWLEMQEAFVSTLDRLFADNEIRPSDVDILIINVCCFASKPSLLAWIVNHYRMREDFQKQYNSSSQAFG